MYRNVNCKLLNFSLRSPSATSGDMGSCPRSCGWHPLLDAQQETLGVHAAHPYSGGLLCVPKLLLLRECCAGPDHEAEIIRTWRHHEIQVGETAVQVGESAVWVGEDAVQEGQNEVFFLFLLFLFLKFLI